MHVKTLTDEVLLQVAADLDMVPDLCYFSEVEGVQTWEPGRIRAIVSKLDDMGWIKRPVAEVYFSTTSGWCVATNSETLKAGIASKKSAYEYCRALGYEPTDVMD